MAARRREDITLSVLETIRVGVNANGAAPARFKGLSIGEIDLAGCCCCCCCANVNDIRRCWCRGDAAYVAAAVLLDGGAVGTITICGTATFELDRRAG